jgi:hypothetical protein
VTAEVRTIDFTYVEEVVQKPSVFNRDKVKPRTAEGKLLTPKQIRARARRKRKRGDHMSKQELDFLYRKPIEQWDFEELAQGRPRDTNGRFSGPKPNWVDRAVHEQAMTMYIERVRTGMRGATVKAVDVLLHLLENNDEDDKGRPIVAASTKTDIAKFLLEHTVGKPTQRVENDVSIKLQGILAQVLVNPGERATTKYVPAHLPGVTMELASSDLDEIVIDG